MKDDTLFSKRLFHKLGLEREMILKGLKHKAKWPSGQVAKQPSSQVAKQPSSQIAKQPSSQVAKQPSSQVAKQPSSRAGGKVNFFVRSLVLRRKCHNMWYKSALSAPVGQTETFTFFADIFAKHVRVCPRTVVGCANICDIRFYTIRKFN